MEHKFYTVQPIKNKVVLSQVKKPYLNIFEQGVVTILFFK